jgi:transposase InsO family protein
LQDRESFISTWRSHPMTHTALCQLHDVSRQTGYKWIKRWKAERSVEEHSRRPHSHPDAVPPKLVRLILSQRRQFPTWGPRKLRKRLQTVWPNHSWPVASTIGSILKRHGLVKIRRKRVRIPPRTKPFSKVRNPNDVWCVDFKGEFDTRDGRTCWPLTVMDAASRYLLACTGFHAPTLDNVREVFVKLFKKYGMPTAIRSDNGEPFASVSPAAGLSQLSAWWVRLGIKLERIDPGEPQQNGRHERMHFTLKNEACVRPAASLGWQQHAFDRFREEYNKVRPHEALDYETPASLFVPSKRPYFDTAKAPLFYPLADVYRVRSDGTIPFGQRKQFITTSLAGELVGLYPVDDRYIEVIYAKLSLGFIDTENWNENPRHNLVHPRQHSRPGRRRSKR